MNPYKVLIQNIPCSISDQFIRNIKNSFICKNKTAKHLKLGQ